MNKLSEKEILKKERTKKYLIMEKNENNKIIHYFYESVKRTACMYARGMKKRKPFSIFTVSDIQRGVILEVRN